MSGVWDWIKAIIWRLLTDLPFDGDLELLRLERMVRDGDAALRRPRVGLSPNIASASETEPASPPARGAEREVAVCHRRRGDVAWMNNAAERVTGRSKIRRKTVRGYKSEDWMLNGFGLTQWAWSGRDGLDMSDLVAA